MNICNDDNSTFLVQAALVLWVHEESPYCIVSLEVNLYAYFVARVLEFFTKSSYVWHCDVYVFVKVDILLCLFKIFS